MLDPLCQMSSVFLLFCEIVRAVSFNLENSNMQPATALTLDSVTCYFQWS
jgi:hypothetical protein